MRAAHRLAGMALAFGVTSAVAGPVVVKTTTPSDDRQWINDNPWVRLCGAEQSTNGILCLVTRELRTDLGALLSTVIVAETLGEQPKRLVVSVPVGMLIQPGVRVQVDGAEDLEARYVISVSYSCYAELAIDAAFIDALKVGNTLRLTAVNQMGKPVELDLILAGFAAAYDGKAMDPAEVAERQEKILRALEAVILGEKDYVVIE